MENWEIQQRIRSLESLKLDLESEMSRLEEKRERLELEYNRKMRQINQVSDLYSSNRTNATLLYDGAESVAVSKAVERFANLYSGTNEEKIISNLRDIQFFLKKCSDEIEEKIEETRSEISSINWQIQSLKMDLLKKDDEVM